MSPKARLLKDVLPWQGLSLRYSLLLPGPPEEAAGRPLVLALHYGWDPGAAAPPAYYGLGLLQGLVYPALAELGAVLAAPDCPGPDWTDLRSEGAVLALRRHLLDTYALDPRRVLLLGYSLGGAGTWHLLARQPQCFRAGVVLAGWPSEDWLEPAEPHPAYYDRPLYVIHSRQDELVPLEPTERAIGELRERGADIRFVPLEGIGHYETGRCAPFLRAALPWIRDVLAPAGAEEEACP
ncbi:MAG: dienelactone hydrolase family protein [Chloroflexia bacterium]|nr:dienelactone hydrolase family protein [Chloroflexia bacterium]